MAWKVAVLLCLILSASLGSRIRGKVSSHTHPGNCPYQETKLTLHDKCAEAYVLKNFAVCKQKCEQRCSEMTPALCKNPVLKDQLCKGHTDICNDKEEKNDASTGGSKQQASSRPDVNCALITSLDQCDGKTKVKCEQQCLCLQKITVDTWKSMCKIAWWKDNCKSQCFEFEKTSGKSSDAVKQSCDAMRTWEDCDGVDLGSIDKSCKDKCLELKAQAEGRCVDVGDGPKTMKMVVAKKLGFPADDSNSDWNWLWNNRNPFDEAEDIFAKFNKDRSDALRWKHIFNEEMMPKLMGLLTNKFHAKVTESKPSHGKKEWQGQCGTAKIYSQNEVDEMYRKWKKEQGGHVHVDVAGGTAKIYSQNEVDEMYRTWEKEQVEPLLQELSELRGVPPPTADVKTEAAIVGKNLSVAQDFQEQRAESRTDLPGAPTALTLPIQSESQRLDEYRLESEGNPLSPSALSVFGDGVADHLRERQGLAGTGSRESLFDEVSPSNQGSSPHLSAAGSFPSLTDYKELRDSREDLLQDVREQSGSREELQGLLSSQGSGTFEERR